MFRAKIFMGGCCAFFRAPDPTSATLRFGICRSTTEGQGFTSANLYKNSGPSQLMPNTNLCVKTLVQRFPLHKEHRLC